METGRVLVAGATGQLGGAIARQLLTAGIPIRAVGRGAARLKPLADAGAEVAVVDLLDLARLKDACAGIAQIVSTANNNMGSGQNSPGRIDLTAHQNLCAAARVAGVRRLMYVSARGITADETVDIFRLKWYIEDAIKRSGVPYVFLRPTAFLDIWVDRILADPMRTKGKVTIFGNGSALANYVAVDDVASFAVRIVERPEVVNESIDVGGPSNISMNDLVTLLERRLGRTVRRSHVPVALMRFAPPLIRPFNEVAARLMSLGHYAATRAQPFEGWRDSAERFGVTPRTAEAYIEGLTV